VPIAENSPVDVNPCGESYIGHVRVSFSGMPHFQSFDGSSLFYDDQGDGRAVVLMHGFVGDINIDWVRSGVLDLLLDEGYRVIAFDARGHGLSDKPHELSAYEDDALTKDAVALLDLIGLDEYLLVGFSMGARTALHVAAIDPRVRAVVALGLGESTLGANGRGMSGVADAMLTDDPDSIEHEQVRHFREMADAIRADREALSAFMAAERTEVLDIVPNVTVPVLIVTGADDVTAGPPGPLAERFANAKAIQTAGDHAGVKDQPVMHDALVEFLASV
jgi:pimeloyl-ACP methyl ester carboxylesterase